MAVIIPDLDPDSIDNLGERLLYGELRRQLPADWMVRYHYPACLLVNGHLQECEADFIVLAPNRGVMFVEVKGSRGWECCNGQWYRLEASGELVSAPNPFFQASHTKHTLMQRFAERLGLSGKHQFPGIFGHLVAYPRAARQGGLPASQEPTVMLMHADMHNLHARLLAAFEQWCPEHRPNLGAEFTCSVMDRLVSLLHDDCRFVVTGAADLDLDEQQLCELTSHQFAAFRGALANRRILVRGVAGSGKTMVAQWLAAELVEQGQRVLMLCFNSLLAAWLRSRQDAAPAYDIHNFHGICHDYALAAGLPFAPDAAAEPTAFWQETAPQLLLNALDTLGDAYRYDAVIIDEAQDFRQDWWLPVQLLLRDADHGAMYVFCDPDQGLYGDGQALPAEVAATVYDLSENCRNTRRIASYCGQVLQRQLPCFGRSPDGVPPIVTEVAADGRARARLARKLATSLLNDGFTADQIAILSPWRAGKSNCSLSHLEQIHGRNVIASDGGDTAAQVSKITEWERGAGIWTGTIRSFKGLEADCVILTDLPAIGTHYFTAADLYVATSRAKHRLYLLPSCATAAAELQAWCEAVSNQAPT